MPLSASFGFFSPFHYKKKLIYQLLSNITNLSSLHPFFPSAGKKFCGSACNFSGSVIQYTSWFLPRRWAAACVCESRHVPQEGSSLLKKPAKSSAARPHPSNSCGGAAPLKACFHQASAPRVRTKVTSLWSGLLQIAQTQSAASS